MTAATESEKLPPPIDLSELKVPENRPEAEILQDLEKLCTSPGYAHALSFLCWKNNFISYDRQELKPDDLDEMKSEDRLLRSELAVLIGLMVKSPVDTRFPSPVVIQQHIEETEKLLLELHHAMSSQLWASLKENGVGAQKNNSMTMGKALRESFFYSGEAAYMFQYRDFSVERYKCDECWFNQNKGFSLDDVKKVIHAVAVIQLKKMDTIRSEITPENIDEATMLPVFTFTKEEIAEETKCSLKTVENILMAFCLKSIPANRTFAEIGAFNETNAYPIIPLDNGKYVLFQNYSLAESAYETPSFWMNEDSSYAETSKKNRGLFTESFSAARLRHVLGADHVFENVCIMNGKNRIGEIDVLAVYADRAIVLQAKSKKLTEAARKGDDGAIQTDFKKAIQDAYDQGFKCAERLNDKTCRLTDEKGAVINIRRDFREVFIFCVVSEYYPALAYQASHFLKKKDHEIIQPPYVMDVFFLDVLCEMLDSPLYFFNFIHRRLTYADKVNSSNELAVLSYHLAYNLWFEEKHDFVSLGDEFSVHVDAAMLSRREGLPGKKTPEGLLTKLEDSFFSYILKKIGSLEKDNVLELGYFLLEISQKSAEEMSEACEIIMDKTRQGGAAHDVTMGFGHAGITIHSSLLPNRIAYQRLHDHCRLGKYRQKAQRWFGLSLKPSSNDPIQIALGLNSAWQQSNGMDRLVQRFPGPRHNNLTEMLRRHKGVKEKKIGRNELCKCGSGKKYKKCCAT